MKLYEIHRDEGIDWDEYDSIIVRAEDKEQALQIAIDFQTYFNEEDVTIYELTAEGDAEVVFNSFNAG